MIEYEEHCYTHMCCVQASEAETKKYEEVQQSEQSAFQASIVDLNQALTSMQSYTDMSAATAVAEEVITAHSFASCSSRLVGYLS